MLKKLLMIEDNARLISITGAGGKTTLMHLLAREYSTKGVKAAMMTTTQTFVSEAPYVENITGESAQELLAAWDRGKVPFAGRRTQKISPNGEPVTKYIVPSESAMKNLTKFSEVIVNEADGAARKAIKYPAVWEPVIPLHTDTVITVAGLSALDQPFATACHRQELYMKNTGRKPDTITEEVFADLITEGYYHLRPTVFLNQADTPELYKRGQRIQELLYQRGFSRVAIGSLHQYQ